MLFFLLIKFSLTMVLGLKLISKQVKQLQKQQQKWWKIKYIWTVQWEKQGTVKNEWMIEWMMFNNPSNPASASNCRCKKV